MREDMDPSALPRHPATRRPISLSAYQPISLSAYQPISHQAANRPISHVEIGHLCVARETRRNSCTRDCL